ncbi:hypothetical protein CJ307_35075, partial [Klebsiella quasipneumoniae]
MPCAWRTNFSLSSQTADGQRIYDPHYLSGGRSDRRYFHECLVAEFAVRLADKFQFIESDRRRAAH